MTEIHHYLSLYFLLINEHNRDVLHDQLIYLITLHVLLDHSTVDIKTGWNIFVKRTKVIVSRVIVKLSSK